MKNSYFEIKDGVLTVRDNVSPRKTVCGAGYILLIIYFAFILLDVTLFLLKIFTLKTFLIHLINPFIIFLCLIVPIISIVIGRRLPPAPKVSFHYDTKTVNWQQLELSLEVPFEKINFKTDRNLSKSGISSVSVSVSVIDEKPFFPTGSPKQHGDDKYVKILWAFYCNTQAEADDMIETIKMFMDGKIDGSPSKFDNL